MNITEHLHKLFALSKAILIVVNKDYRIEYKHPTNLKVSEDLSLFLKKIVDSNKRSRGDPKLILSSTDFGYVTLENNSLFIICPKILKNGNSKTGVFHQLSKEEMVFCNGMLEHMAMLTEYELKDLNLQNITDSILAEKYAPLKDYGPVVKIHNQYRVELAYQDAVRTGDIEAAKRAMQIPLGGNEGILGFDKLRTEKNHANLMNVLCSRAAIKAGVNYEEAYSLSDKLFLAVETCNDPDEVFKMRERIVIAFATQVKNYLNTIKTNKVSIHVNNAIIFIKRNIYNKLTLDSIASHLGLNKDYLQRLFKKNLNITILKFIEKERIQIAKELLEFSDLSINDIANLLVFSSNAHFSKQFKENEGISPHTFRNNKRITSG